MWYQPCHLKVVVIVLWNVVAAVLSDGGSNCAKECGSYHVNGIGSNCAIER